MFTLWLCLTTSFLPPMATPPRQPTPAPRSRSAHAASQPSKIKRKNAATPTNTPAASQPSSQNAPASRPAVTTKTIRDAIRKIYNTPPTTSSTAPPAPPAPPTAPTAPKPMLKPPKLEIFNSGSMFWVQTFGMLLALGIIVVGIYIVMRWVSKQVGLPGQYNQGLLSVKDRLSLEPKKGLWLIEAAGKTMLIATHEQGITLLQTLDENVVQEQLQQQETTKPAPFWKRIKQEPQTPQEPQETTTTDDTNESPAPQSAIPTQFEVISDGQSTPPKEK